MSKLTHFTAALVMIITVPTASAFAEERREAPRPPASTEAPGGTPLIALIEAMPDGADVLAPYATATTVGQIKSANALLRKEIEQGRLIESNLGKIHLAAMQSCAVADQLDRAPIDAIAGKARIFRGVADDVDGRIKKSVADMKKLLARPGAGAYRMKHEVEDYEAAYAEFVQLHLEIDEVVKGLDRLAATMPDAKAICRPSIIPPLTGKSSPKTVAVKPRSMAPLNILNRTQ